MRGILEDIEEKKKMTQKNSIRKLGIFVINISRGKAGVAVVATSPT